MLVLLQGEVPGAAKQATLTSAVVAKQATAGAEAAKTLSPAKPAPRGKENVTPDRDQVSPVLGAQQLRKDLYADASTERLHQQPATKQSAKG